MSNLFQKKEVHLFYNLGTDKRPEKKLIYQHVLKQNKSLYIGKGVLRWILFLKQKT